jgi:hypothetical protein
VVDVLAQGSLGMDIVADVYAAAVADFRKFGFNVVNKGSKLANIDRATLLELLVQVGDERTPDYEHLRGNRKLQKFDKLGAKIDSLELKE